MREKNVSLWSFLQRNFKDVVSNFNEKLSDTQLTLFQFLVVEELMKYPSGVAASVVAKALLMDRSSMSRMLERLARVRFIKRERDKEDRRFGRCVLLQKGKSAYERAVKIVYDHPDKKVMEGLTAIRDAINEFFFIMKR